MSYSPVIAITHPDKDEIHQETKVLLRLLKNNGYTCVCFDWRSLDRSISYADVIIHKYVGSIREKYNDGFRRYLRYVDRIDDINFINCLDSYRYGIRKDYLLDMQRSGFPVVPTIRLSKDVTYGYVLKMKDILDVDDAVIKPIDGELAQDVEKVSQIRKSEFRKMKARTSSILLQPFISEIAEGERSVAVLMVGGEITISHGIKRVPREWIAQSTSCCKITQTKPTQLEKQITRRVFNSPPFRFLDYGFFRVDFIGETDKLINEVEIVNPQVGLNYLAPTYKKEYVNEMVKIVDYIT